MSDEQMNREQIAAMAGAERKQRAEACMIEVEAALKKHNCAFDFGLVLRAGQTPEPFYRVVAQ